MDVNDLRTVITSLSLFTYLGIVFWVYISRRASDFDEAANTPFEDDDVQQFTIDQQRADRRARLQQNLHAKAGKKQ